MKKKFPRIWEAVKYYGKCYTFFIYYKGTLQGILIYYKVNKKLM